MADEPIQNTEQPAVETPPPVPADEPVINPAEIEGTRNTPQGATPLDNPEHPRFKEIYWRAKENERLANERAAEVEKERQRAAELERDLSETREQFNKFLKAPQPPAQPADTQPPLTLSQYEQALDKLIDEKAQAMAEFDAAKIADIEKKIRRVERAMQKAEGEQTVIHAEQQRIKEDIDKAVEAFVSTTPWFSEKSARGDEMREWAAFLENKYARDWKGTPTAFYEKIKTDTEKKFNYGTTTPPPATVAGVNTTKPSAPVSQPQLSEAEMRVARGLFPNSKDPYGEYAQAKARLGGV